MSAFVRKNVSIPICKLNAIKHSHVPWLLAELSLSWIKYMDFTATGVVGLMISEIDN